MVSSSDITSSHQNMILLIEPGRWLSTVREYLLHSSLGQNLQHKGKGANSKEKNSVDCRDAILNCNNLEWSVDSQRSSACS